MRKILCFAVPMLLLMLGTAAGDSIEFYFTFENDGHVNPDDGPFGTLTVTEGTNTVDGVLLDSLTFTIDIDDTKFDGDLSIDPSVDNHEFGFMLNFTGAILDPETEYYSGQPIVLSEPGEQISGRNGTWDYSVDFGDGQPYLDPVQFTINGAGLDLQDLYDAGIQTQNDKPNAQFLMHVQSTSPGLPGVSTSEALGGIYGGGGIEEVPAPSAIAGLLGLGLMGLAVGLRRRKLC